MWFIVGTNEVEFKTLDDLRLFINGSGYKRQLNIEELKFPHLVMPDEAATLVLQNYIYSNDKVDYPHFIDTFMTIVEKKYTAELVDSPADFTVSHVIR